MSDEHGPDDNYELPKSPPLASGTGSLPPLVEGPITIDPNDPVILEILSMMCFQCGPIAHVFQKAGYPIPTRAENEQGSIILWCLSLYRDHGQDWRAKGDEKLKSIRAAGNDKAEPPTT